MKTRLSKTLGPLIPAPRKATLIDADAQPVAGMTATVADPQDQWVVAHFADWATKTLDVSVTSDGKADAKAWRLVINRSDTGTPEAYKLNIQPGNITVTGDAPGVFYGLQTLRQLLKIHRGRLPAVEIKDAPALRYRAMHLDTKHHQPTEQYIYDVIDELAHYKANVLVWEWENKFNYQSHPDIPVPGAFAREQMLAFNDYARQRHMQLVPLVQGLGHVSYILKFPQFRHLREVPDSNWEFNPLEEGTYDLLFALFDEAIDATPGSEFIHIGSDETFELGKGRSREYAEKHGTDALMQVFIRRCVAHCESRGRKVLSWGGRWRPDMKEADHPPKSMIFTDGEDTDYFTEAKKAGFPCWVYATNPGIDPLVLPLFPNTQPLYWEANGMGRVTGRNIQGAFLGTAGPIGTAARAGVVDGSITTSWEDSGLHLQVWMPRFVCAAEFSWNPEDRSIERWAETFFANYFGSQSRDLRELFTHLYDGAHFYNHTFQRAVWHWYNLGKMHLPDMPRGDLEYNNYYRVRNKELIRIARDQRQRMDRAIDIIDTNRAAGVDHDYDMAIYRTCAELIGHNANLILMLGNLEQEIQNASGLHFMDNHQAAAALDRGTELIRENLAEREAIYTNLVKVWERTRMPKGMSLENKKFVHVRDRARHFANRTPDMSYLILDEQLLDLEGFLARLITLAADYRKQHCV